MESITWTGDNYSEMEGFSYKSNWAYFAGSNYFNYRWYHRVWEWLSLRLDFLPEWEPPDDPMILEIYFIQQNQDHYWTHMRPGDSIDREGKITRGTG